ncbi:MAG: HD-GYP domain-containing protein [bacterium]
MKPAPTATGSAGGDQALALALAVAIRTGAYYDADNAVTQEACSHLASLLAERGEEGHVTIGVHSHSVFVGETRIRTTASTYERFTYLSRLFKSWDIRALTFNPELGREELAEVVILLAREWRAGSADLADILHARGLDLVWADKVVNESQPQAIVQAEAYAAAMQVSGRMRESAEGGEAFNIRRARRIAQVVVKQILQDPQALVALTTIKDFDRFLICHSIDVAVLAVVLGRRLGMSKAKLGELCLAGLLHDAGKLGLPRAILNKPGTLDADEQAEVRRHPILGALSLLSDRRLTSADMNNVVVAFEHHLNYDLTGYPRIEIKDHVTLFGRIVAIVDRYDAMTSPRPYRDRNFTPHEALVYVIRNAGRYFDPILVKLFVEIMGLYPPGTMVELTSGELAVVFASPASGRPLDRPKVRVVARGEPGTTLDLDESVGGEFLRGVKSVLNPENKGQLPAVAPSIFDASG